MNNNSTTTLNRQIAARVAASMYEKSRKRAASQPNLTERSSYDVVDQTSIDSFPASDPPAWTCGIDPVAGETTPKQVTDPVPGSQLEGVEQ